MTDASHLRQLIKSAVQAGDPATALAHVRTLICSTEASAQDYLEGAALAERFLDNATALAAMREAHRRAQEDMSLLLRLAELEHVSGNTRNALACLEVVSGQNASPSDLGKLGALYGRIGEVERAHSIYERIAALQPNNYKTKENCAIGLAFLGRTDEAENLYDQVILGGQPTGLTYLNRSWLRRQTESNNHIDQLLGVLKGLPSGRRVAPYLYYALAKEYEDLGQMDRSIACVEKAAAQRRSQIDYSIAREVERLKRLAATFDKAFFENRPEGCPTNEPIFILGMPRSGSTLAERFLANHSQVFAAGELQNFTRVVRVSTSAAAIAQGIYDNPDRVNLFHAIDMESLGESYLNSTRPRTGHMAHFIDKYPINFVNLGAIAAALPNAKIIHMERNPMDACYAMYKQSFQQAYQFTYEQTELAQYYAAYRRLMAHWEDVLPGRIIRLRYEDLVNAPEDTMRRLIKELGLVWEDACVDHRSNNEASMTASATQVRQPLYTSSIGKWRALEHHLEPMARALVANGIELE